MTTHTDPEGTALDREKPSRRRAWAMTSLLLVLTLINFADQVVFGIIAQPLAEELGLSASDLGLVGSLFYLALTAGSLCAGVLERWLALRWALVVLAIIWALTTLPLVVSASFATLILSRVLLGLAEGPSVSLIFTGTYSWHRPAERGIVGAVLTGSAACAQFAIIPVLAWVTVAWGWRTALLCLSVGAILWCLVWLAKWEQGPYLTERVESVGSDDPAPAATASVPWREIFFTRTFISCAFLCFSVFALGSAVLTWMPSYLEVGLGYSRLQAGALSGIPSIVGLFIMLGTSAVSDRLAVQGRSIRFVRIVLPTVGVIVSGLILVALPLVAVPIVVVAAVSFAYGLKLTCLPLVQAAIAELCPPSQTAGTLGTLVGIFTLGGFVAPYATGRIVEAAASPAAGYAAAFQIFGVVAVVAGCVAIALADPDRDRARPVASEEMAREVRPTVEESE